MATIICKQCGYENPQENKKCEICDTSLIQLEVAREEIKNIESIKTESSMREDSCNQSDKEYYVLCQESQTKTVVQNENITSFYCQGCKREHVIDGLIWTVDVKENIHNIKNSENTEKPTTCTKIIESNKVVLEEVNSHVKIEIDKNGGTIGRYGNYGSDFFQSRNLLMVSGEHCLITNEYGDWVIRHKSRTNQTKYNNMILGLDEPNILENGKILTLANAVSFVVRIE